MVPLFANEAAPVLVRDEPDVKKLCMQLLEMYLQALGNTFARRNVS
jgi:hypothetical protein